MSAAATAGGARQRWTVLEVLRWTTERFTRAGVDSPRLDAEVLLAHCLGVERIALYVDHAKPLRPPELSRYREAIRRRLTREPVAYIVGDKEFWSLSLRVDRRVLVPRPDSELLVELGTAWLAERDREAEEPGARAGGPARAVVDVATGSGALIVALGHERRTAGDRLFATDRSLDALAVARTNASRHELDIALVCADLLAPLSGPFDLVLANLPYIPSEELARLPEEIRRWEPPGALDGGPDGLDVIRRLVAQLPARLAPGGAVMLEIAPAQQGAVENLLDRAGMRDIRAHRDLAGDVRAIAAVA